MNTLTLDDGSVITFQMGETATMDDPKIVSPTAHQPTYLSMKGYQLLMRGPSSDLCEEIAHEIKENRLLPRLYAKQIKMLYGSGPHVYTQTFRDGKLKREYTPHPAIDDWLHTWDERGLPTVEEFCRASIKNFYYFGDYFAKWRFSRGKQIGVMPVAGLEAMENRHCLLATRRTDAATALLSYGDFTHVAVARWPFDARDVKFYPRFAIADADQYHAAAISHHRDKAVDEYYGSNETHQGARPYIQGANKTAHYINSFLKNSLAAKLHIIIPNAWVESKRNQIVKLCEENKKRKAAGQSPVTYNGIDIGTEFRESTLIEYVRQELRKLGQYLSGAENQGKAYSTFSFIDGAGHEQTWRIENIDMRYKEYIEAMIAYDKRAEEALLSSVGMDASISAVSKDGIISKSGADTYYNYLIYIMQLTTEDDICSEPLNLALRLNFPDLYRQGYRIGFFRQVPQRQEDTPPKDRLNQQQA